MDTIVELIGKEPFKWLSSHFDKRTSLKDIPDQILDALAALDITLRNYGRDKNAVTCIALLTFAYKMAGKAQKAPFGPKDMLLLKVLAKEEATRRRQGSRPSDGLWKAPLFQLITGEVGERIRTLPTMNSPL